jgi:hypothetical protein
MALRVIGPSGPWSSSAIGVLTSVPWCCVLPAGLASLGLASSVLARWLGAATPALLVASAVFLGRAHYLLWARRHGSRLARFTTVVLTLLSACLWTFRLTPQDSLLGR